MINHPLDRLFDDLTNPDSPGNRNRVTSGLTAFDGLHRGFDAGHLVTVAARDPRMATDFTLGIVRRAARAGHPAYIATDQERLTRTLTADARAGVEAGAAPIRFDTISTDRAVALDVFTEQVERHAKTGLRLAVIDPFTDLGPDWLFTPSVERGEFLDEASRALHRLAKKCEVTVIAVAALKEAADANAMPLLRDLGEADGLTYDSDTVIIAYGAGPDRPGMADIVIAKHRNGPAGIVTVRYDPESGRFADLDAPGGAR